MAKIVKSRTFLADQSGGSTAFALSLTMGAFMLGGLALDVAYAYKSRNELQIAADAAAHTALYVRQEDTAATAKTKAIGVASGMLPASNFGNVLDEQDIQFGSWDSATQMFSAESTEKDAVLVSTKRFAANGNSVQTFLLNFLGVNEFDVRADSVFVTHFPTCLRQGFAANDVVDVQSNNKFYSGFCIHSNDHVSMNQNNTFEAGVVVSMPNSAEASSGSGNDGLAEALRDHRYKLRLLDRMDDVWSSLQSGGEHVPAYITNSAVVNVTADTITGTNPVELLMNGTQADLQSGRIYKIDCGAGGRLTFDDNVIVADVVILTTCELKFNEGAAVENALLMTQNTSIHSVSSASAFRMGRNDDCAADGGAQILTYGSVHFPSGLEVYGGQIIAKQDIAFAANADGVQGVSFIAGGAIDGTSNANIRSCTTGMEQNFELPYFRLAG